MSCKLQVCYTLVLLHGAAQPIQPVAGLHMQLIVQSFPSCYVYMNATFAQYGYQQFVDQATFTSSERVHCSPAT